MTGHAKRPARRDGSRQVSRHDAQLLGELLRKCELAGIERHCFVLFLSRLPADLARPHHLRLAADAIEPLSRADRAQRFVLPNGDIAMVWRGAADATVAACQRGLTDLFADLGDAAFDAATLGLVLHLPFEGDTLRRLIDASVTAAEPAGAAAPPLEALDTAALAALEAALARADVARFARRRCVCAMSPGGAFQTQWETRYLSLDELALELAPDRALQADPWLFRRLAHTLDRRLLALLASPDELRDAGPFGLDLNVASLLAPEFIRFDAALPQDLRGQVTLGLLPEDLLADPSAFLFARDFARSRGYRLKLCMPAAELLPVMPLARLGLDLLELHWSLDLTVLDPDIVEREAPRLVLADADTADAIVWGRLCGITRFEGKAALPGQRIDRPPLTGS
jgi:hypothetical protein